ncbi:MAG: SBBP repeat-containing protein [Acidobacteriota bacterium]|nr:SBBP repeat-containing protein [Acidobacteriota bacterium]
MKYGFSARMSKGSFRLFAFAAGAAIYFSAPYKPAAPSNVPVVNITESMPQQFSSQGHVLSFGTSSMVVAAADHMMKVEMAGGKSVDPVRERATAKSPMAKPIGIRIDRRDDDGKCAPLIDRVTYPDVWNGVTVTYRKAAGAIIESAYRIEAGADPCRIRLRYNRPAKIDGNGDLVVAYERGEIRESAPVAWQDIKGKRINVAVSFRRLSEHEVGFDVRGYDETRPLYIDPWLTWHTFLGGSAVDEAAGITVDGSGNIYIAGYSAATWGTPIRAYTSGAEAFVAKLDSSGNLTWHTFLGGGEGKYDRGFGIALDGNGAIYVTGGSSGNWGLPVRAHSSGGDFAEGFAAELDNDGNLVWNTFLSGSSYGYEIAHDASGNIFVVGDSQTGDAFVAKLDGSGNLTWSKTLGEGGYGSGNAIAVDGSGNIYAAGYSTSTWGSPVRAYTSGNDAFAAKLDGSGNLTWHTFLGGSASDYGYGITVDENGNIYVSGSSFTTWGSPVTAYSSSSDAFAAKLNSNGNLAWNTFLGGSSGDDGYGIDLDGSGNLYVTGKSSATWGTPRIAFTSSNDSFAAKLDNSGNLTWNLFLGGSGSDFGFGIAVDANGNIYVAGYSDAAWGSPINAYTSNADAFVVKMPNEPTAVELISLKAQGEKKTINITWQTASERDNAGFHLWKKAETEKEFVRMTPALIPARGDMVLGAIYEYVDGGVEEGTRYLYKLECVDMNGENSFHGPIEAMAGTIELLSPANGARLSAGMPIVLEWNGGRFERFRVELTGKPELAVVNMFPMEADSDDWIWETKFIISPQILKQLGSTAIHGGVIRWRVRGKTATGSEVVSETAWIILSETEMERWSQE